MLLRSPTRDKTGATSPSLLLFTKRPYVQLLNKLIKPVKNERHIHMMVERGDASTKAIAHIPFNKWGFGVAAAMHALMQFH